MLAQIDATGAEAVLADPDRVATIIPALDHVSVVCVLLGSAVGDDEALQALHGPRLEMLLSRTLDTTVHGFLYEAAGSVDAAVLGRGAEIVGSICDGSRIPYALLDADCTDAESWVRTAGLAVEALISR
jgi:hypothetical protein